MSKLEDFALKVQDRDQLNEQVQQLQKELQVAKTEIAEQVCHNAFFFFTLEMNSIFLKKHAVTIKLNCLVCINNEFSLIS